MSNDPSTPETSRTIGKTPDDEQATGGSSDVELTGLAVPPDDTPPAAPPIVNYYTIGTVNPKESPWDVAVYLWGKGSFASQLVTANLERDWEDGVEIVIPDIEF